MKSINLDELKEKQASTRGYKLSPLKQDVLNRKINKALRKKEKKMKRKEQKANWKEVTDSITDLNNNLTHIASVGIYAYDVLKQLKTTNDKNLLALTTKVDSLLNDVNHYHRRISVIESKTIHSNKEVTPNEYGLFLMSFEQLNEIFTDTNRVLLPTVVEIQNLIDELADKYNIQREMQSPTLNLNDVQLATAI